MDKTILAILLLLTLAFLANAVLWIMQEHRRKAQEDSIFEEIDYLLALFQEDLNEQQKVLEYCEYLFKRIDKQEKDFKEFGNFISKVTREIKMKDFILKKKTAKVKASHTT